MRTLVRFCPLLLSLITLACELPSIGGTGGAAASTSSSGGSSSSGGGEGGASSSTGGALPALIPPEGCTGCWDACGYAITACADDPVCAHCVMDPDPSSELCAKSEAVQDVRRCLLMKHPLDCTAKGCVPGPYHVCNPVTAAECDDDEGGACVPGADWFSDPQFTCDYAGIPEEQLPASCEPCEQSADHDNDGCKPGNLCVFERCYALCCDDADCGPEGRCSWDPYHAIGWCVTHDSLDIVDAINELPIPACNVPAAADKPSGGSCFQ